MNTFQSVVLGIFGFFVIAGLIALSLTKGRGSEQATTLTMWGALSAANFQELSKDFFPERGALKIAYREIAEEDLDQELLEALASGRGPDMVFLPADLLLRYRDKLSPVPYEILSLRQYKDSYIQEGDLFLFPEGIEALPFAVDPLIMYFNRDLLDAGAVATVPRFWDEFLLLGNRLTERDRVGNIARSAAPLGEFRNVAHAKEILSAMFMQSGIPVVSMDAKGFVSPTLDRAGAESVLDFYAEFANPAKPSYSWNRSLPRSTEAFLSQRSVFYFGFGSELAYLKSANPNLNFDAAPFPSPRTSQVPITYGKLTGIAVLRSSPLQSQALQTALTLTGSQAVSKWSALSGTPPVRRELLSARPTDAFGGILYDAAIRARGFLDPNPASSRAVFQDMIESVTSGRSDASEALSRADQQLRGLIK